MAASQSPDLAARWPWWTVPSLVAAALACLLLGVWIGWTLLAGKVAGQVATVSVIDLAKVRAQIELQQQANAALEREIAAAQAALAGDVCTADNPQGATK